MLTNIRDRVKGLVPFLPLPHFLVGFGLYSVVGLWFMTMTNDMPLLLAAAVVLVTGLALTAALSGYFVLTSNRQRKVDPELPEVEENDQDDIRRTKRVALVKREASKMRARVLKMGAWVGITMMATWYYFYALNGDSPLEVFILPLWAIVLTWLLCIVLLPPWMTWMTLASVIGMRFAFELWGATILLLLPNFLMLPFFYFFMMIFMFGSIMIPNLMQFKFYKPGDATWEVPKGTMRGQPEARAIVEMEMEKFRNHAMGLTDRPATRGMIFEGPPGPQPLTSMVLTPNGWRQMGSLSPGDFVIGSEGLPCRILEVYDMGYRDISLVRFSDGAEVRASEDHLWAVRSKKMRRSGGPMVLGRGGYQGTLIERYDGNWRVLETRSLKRGHSVPLVKPIELQELEQELAFPVHPYVLGALLGDGSLTSGGSVVFTNTDKKIVDRVETLLPGKVVMKNNPVYPIRYALVGMWPYIDKLKLRDTNSRTKFIPEEYFKGSSYQRLELLRGLMDTDGSATRRIGRKTLSRFSTSSVALRDGVIDLVRSLGGTSSWSEASRKPGEYTVNVVLSVSPFWTMNKSKNTEREPKRLVVEVVPDGKELTRCLLIDSEDHLYVTDDYVLTHNTGKTLLAKELGTEFDLPFAFTDAQAFNAPFMGFGPLVVYYFRWRTEQLAKEYGGAIVFIDEAETLLQSRSGMGQPGMMGEMEVWDMFDRDEMGRVRYNDIIIDTGKPYTHPMFFGGGGMGGANVAIFPFLTWLNGADGPPMMKKMVRRKFNDLLNGLFLPPVVGDRILRLPAGKPENQNLMFIAATNRAWMLDEAIRRPGRFGVTVRFKTPDFKSRVEVADLYFTESVNKGWMRDDLNTQERREELARATQGMSPAEIEAVIKAAPDVRIHHVENLKRLKNALAKHEEFTEDDKKFWKRHGEEILEEGWDDYRADWRSLMEARSQTLYGRATPGMTSEAHLETTAIHEFMGHFIQLKAFMSDTMRPQVLTIMPRGSALGMVAYVPVEERDPMPQKFYEAMLRVSVGSVMAERFFYGENQPGVIGDLENATSVATFMVSKCAMVPYRWLEMEEDVKERYRKIGESFRAVADSPNPMAKSVLDKVMSDPSKREKVEVFLGMAAVDSYRLILANAKLAEPVVKDLLEVDEFSGQRLEDLWKWLDEELVVWPNDKYIIEQQGWPDRHFAIANPFYTDAEPEVKEVLG